MPTVEIVIFGLLAGATVCASGPSLPETCKPEVSGRATFTGLRPGAAYRFRVTDAAGSYGLEYTTEAAPTAGDWQAKYQACATSDFQKWDLIQKYKRLCGKKCRPLW